MEEEKTEKEDKSGMPVKQEIFLEAGMHIGTKIRTTDMRKFVFKRRDDGLFILDLRKSSERLMSAAKLIGKYAPEEVLVVASRVYSSNPASKFSLLTGIPLVKGRFVPGTMTNIACKSFREPRMVIVCDPKGEREAIRESAKNGIPVIAMCDTDNETKFIDLVVPINNKGKRSLALAFYILAREIMVAQGKIGGYSDFQYDVSYFEQPLPEKEVSKGSESAEAAAKAEEAMEAVKAEGRPEAKAEEKPGEAAPETKDAPKKKPVPKSDEPAKESAESGD